MRFRRWEERQMIAGVCIQCRKNRKREPNPGGGHMGTHDEYTQERRK